MVADTNGVKTPTKPASKSKTTAAVVKRVLAVASQPSRAELDNGVPMSTEPAQPFEAALQKLTDLIQTSHQAVTDLTNTLQPFLPDSVFSDEGCTGTRSSDPERSTVGSSLSPALSAVYSNLNELDRLIARLEYLRQMVVL
jgi:hypothetical protein